MSCRITCCVTTAILSALQPDLYRGQADALVAAMRARYRNRIGELVDDAPALSPEQQQALRTVFGATRS